MRLTEAINFLTAKKRSDIVRFSHFQPAVGDEKLRKEYQSDLKKFNKHKKMAPIDLYED